MQNSRAVSQLPSPPAFSRVLRPVRACPADIVRPTRAEIDLAALRHNFAALQRRSKSPIWPVVKADAYGHGAKAIARTLERAGAQGFCVALVEEALELREAGVFAPILVMGAHYGQAYSELLQHHITPVIGSPEQVEALALAARQKDAEPLDVHLKIDTGMGRLGAGTRELPAILAALKLHPEVQLGGLMTHFACADTDPELVKEQLTRFAEAEKQVSAAGLAVAFRHAANTAALLNAPDSHFEMTRPGIGLFGVEPTVGACPELRPVMRVRTAIVALRELQPGDSVGYGATWKAERPSRIATVPMGYADGLNRLLSGRGSVVVSGKRCPLVGTVSMDMATIDVTDIPARVGDEVVVLGSQRGPAGQDAITATEIAEHCGSIPWEVLTNVSRRVPRFYREP